jgi:acyl-CoA synthetase (AMP-forming)/AMP-acid ligase II
MPDHWLLDRLREFGRTPAIVCDASGCSYAELYDKARFWRSWLVREGVEAGDCVCLRSNCTADAVGLMLALIDRGAIVCPLETAQPDYQGRLAIARIKHACELGPAGITRRELPVADEHPLLEGLRRRAEPGLIVFSSATAGESKAILHNMNVVLRKFLQPKRALRTLLLLPFDHFGGLNTIWHTLTSGGTLVVPAERTPQTVCRAIERHKVQLLPTTPTFLNMFLMSRSYRDHDVSSLALITYGAEPMLDATLRALTNAFPSVRVKQTYGLSEIGVLRTASKSNDSLHMKLYGEGLETRVVNDVLWIRSSARMLGYLNADCALDDGWFNTADIVQKDGEYLRVLGRASDVINVGGLKVFPTEVESLLLQIDNVRDATVRGTANPITGQAVVATVALDRPEDPAATERRILEYCRGRLAPHKIPVRIEVESAIERTAFKRTRRPPPSQHAVDLRPAGKRA